MVLVNTTAAEHYAVLTIPELPAKTLRGLFDKHTFKPVENKFSEKLKAYATRAYVWGEEAKLP